jgi:glycosyltransferase involved in cell wall biosynthesis
MLSALGEHYGLTSPSRVIWNGRAASPFPPCPKEPFVLTAGRLWDEAKNVAAIERVAPCLSWPVYVAGESRHPTGSSRELTAAQQLGRLSAPVLAGWLARASIYVLPARYEPFGLSVLEAALAGCALVLGDIASLRELWDGAAIFVGPDDPTALQRCLQRLIADPAEVSELASRARARAVEYTPERMATSYHSAYVEMQARRHERGEAIACAS